MKLGITREFNLKYGIIEGFRMHSSKTEYGLILDGDRLDLFPLVRELGFQGIELGFDLYYRNDPLWAGEKGIYQAISEKANLTEVEIASICLHLLNYKENSLISDEVSHRKISRGIILKTINICAKIGASIILVPFFGTATVRSDKQRELLISELKYLSQFAEDNNVYLSLETTLSAPELIHIINSIKSNYVKVYFDTGNMASRGNLVHEIELLGDFISQVHVKDYPSRILGEGIVNFSNVISELKKTGFEGYLVLETPSLDNSVREARNNLNYLKKIVAKTD
jgi:sugar phosphate isomerase/epimerase